MAPRYAMSNSESEPDQPAPAAPSDDALEKALRDAVAEVYKSGKMEELTVKRVRLAAEKSLGLDGGFFKGDSNWKAKSEEVIKDEVETQDQAPKEPASDHEKEPSPPPSKPAKPTKRTKAEAPLKSNKRRKPSPEEEAEVAAQSEENEVSEEEVKKPAKKQSKAVAKKTESPPSKENVSDDSDAAEGEDKPTKADDEDLKDGSESEMSVVLDEEPQPKPARKRQKSADAPAKKGGKKAPKAPAKGKDADLDPDQAEIKRLQGWLIKCGIRKMWARELASYDTGKAKIKHLKEMLKEAGMEGRYSLEKAKKIREERELKADLEMVQEGAKRWGTEGADEDEEGEEDRPRRRLARGRKSLAFLDDEGEETD